MQTMSIKLLSKYLLKNNARNIPQPALLKLMILYTWDGCLRESLEVPKGSQATCSV